MEVALEQQRPKEAGPPAPGPLSLFPSLRSVGQVRA